MDRSAFWAIIEDARTTTGDAQDVAAVAVDALQKLSPEEIISFGQHIYDLLADSYRWDLWAVAYIVNGGCSDDGFDYFRGWLIAQGRQRFEAALARPEVIGDWAEPEECEAEDMLSIAWDAYAAKTGEDLPIDALTVKTPADPAGNEWDEDELEDLYPTLWNRFG